MGTTSRQQRFRENKKNGRIAASEWSNTTSIEQQVVLAGCDFEYGDTLDDLQSDGFDVPSSSDANFSWGFYKQVKSRVFNAMYKMSDVSGADRQVR